MERKGVGTQGKPAPMLGVDDAIHVAAGYQSTCVVRRSGTVACVGQGVARAAPVRRIFEEVEELALGGRFGCARLHDGTLRCWGNNSERDRWDAPAHLDANALPVPGLTSVVRVVAGGATACAIERDGSVWCWGDDFTGLLEDACEHGLCTVRTWRDRVRRRDLLPRRATGDRLDERRGRRRALGHGRVRALR